MTTSLISLVLSCDTPGSVFARFLAHVPNVLTWWIQGLSTSSVR